VRVTDESGKVRDTKQERIEQKRELGELATKYFPGDRLLMSTLTSYDTSTSDADNELVHLFEIRGALAAGFGSQAHACSTLRISKDEFDRLHHLCNNEPLRQGRQ